MTPMKDTGVKTVIADLPLITIWTYGHGSAKLFTFHIYQTNLLYTPQWVVMVKIYNILIKLDFRSEFEEK